MRSRKSGDVQTGEYKLKENVEYGNAAAISVISHIQLQNFDPYTYNDKETFMLGDVRFYSDNQLMLVTEAEGRDPFQFDKIWKQEWEPRLSKRPGYDDHSLLIDKKIVNSSTEFHKTFIHIWFDIKQAKKCYEDGTMPTRFITMRYSAKNQEYLSDKFRWMYCRDKDGNLVKEWKAHVPFSLLTKFELKNNKFIGEKYANASNNNSKSSGISKEYYG